MGYENKRNKRIINILGGALNIHCRPIEWNIIFETVLAEFFHNLSVNQISATKSGRIVANGLDHPYLIFEA